MQEDIIIIEPSAEDIQYVEPIGRFLAQLTSSPVNFDDEAFVALVTSPASSLFLLLCNNKVCGMLTLAHYLAPTGRKMWIEDVVVDSAMRGRSFGRLLVAHAIEKARAMGGTLMLTSRASRIAANALYRSSGFQPKETNVYKMNL